MLLFIFTIYYADQLDFIIQNLKNIQTDYDLYVTIVGNDRQPTVDKLLEFNPNCRFVDVENIGYDVWPFIKIINMVDLSKYSYVIKLHTKRDMPGVTKLGNGFAVGAKSGWRDDLYAFIKTPENLWKCIKALGGGRVGMCCRYNLKHGKANHCGVISVAKKCYPNYVLGLRRYCFVAGTMFISRIEPIQKLKELNIPKELFRKPDAEHSVQFAHVIERTIGECVYKSGMVIDDPFTPKKYIRKVKCLCLWIKWKKRLINYLVFPIFVAKYRRKLRMFLRNNYVGTGIII